ncbi:MAG: methylated-DNA--[protein]-cysteine S-methyltransferase, partial [Actinomadura rubrobrunea]|nr:methylated-DNA--[protein]-cysteine S-methyltransferase [Actinomadura rubrobrunea]
MERTLAFGAFESALGRLLVAVTEDGVACLRFRDTEAERARAAAATGLPVVDDPE